MCQGMSILNVPLVKPYELNDSQQVTNPVRCRGWTLDDLHGKRYGGFLKIWIYG